MLTAVPNPHKNDSFEEQNKVPKDILNLPQYGPNQSNWHFGSSYIHDINKFGLILYVSNSGS